MIDRDVPFRELETSLKRVAAALRGAGIPFVLGGGLAIWARGGPESVRDLDFMLKPEDAEAALEALGAAGLRTERPPEEWLYKAWDGPVGIDLIFEPSGLPMTDEVIERADELHVASVAMRVMSSEDVFVAKLLALEEHSLRFEALIQSARSLREQVDWQEVRERTARSPFARAFFVMVEGLHIVERPRRHEEAGATVRVLSRPARRRPGPPGG